MYNSKKWSNDEERVLMDQVSRQATLKEAFEVTSVLLNKTVNACNYHYYAYIKPKGMYEANHEIEANEAHKEVLKGGTPKKTFYQRIISFIKILFDRYNSNN